MSDVSRIVLLVLVIAACDEQPTTDTCGLERSSEKTEITKAREQKSRDQMDPPSRGEESSSSLGLIGVM